MALAVLASMAVAFSMQIAAATPESDAAQDAISAAWQAAGGDASALGAPQGDVYPAGAGFAQDFTDGKIFYSPETGAKALFGAILDEYVSMGGPGEVGFPTTEEVHGLASDSRMVTFSAPDGPVIYWTPEHGAYLVRGPINAAWDQLGSSTGALGVPAGDESYDGPVVTQKFSGGSLSFNDATKTFSTVPSDLADQLAGLQVQVDPAAAIGYAWRAAGGENGVLGALRGAQYPVGGDGIGQDFAHGKVYFTSATGASAIEGEVLAKYESLGGPAGSDLGFPTSSEAAGPIAGSRMSDFAAADRPVIFFSPDNGAFVVRGALRVAWDKLSGATGKLGAPVGDQSLDGDVVSQKFAAGTISWNRATNTFSTDPAELAESLSGLQIPGLNLPGTSKSTVAGDHGGWHWRWSWLLFPAAVFAALGLLGALARWWRRRRLGLDSFAALAGPAKEDAGGEQWSSGRHPADVTGGAPSDYYETLKGTQSVVDPSGPQEPSGSWPGFDEMSGVDMDDSGEADTAPTRIPVTGDLQAGRHAASAAPPDEQASVQPVMHLPLQDPYQQPDGYPIKANIGSGLYYTADNALYADTLADIWFATEEAAELNGFVNGLQ